MDITHIQGYQAASSNYTTLLVGLAFPCAGMARLAREERDQSKIMGYFRGEKQSKRT